LDIVQVIELLSAILSIPAALITFMAWRTMGQQSQTDDTSSYSSLSVRTVEPPSTTVPHYPPPIDYPPPIATGRLRPAVPARPSTAIPRYSPSRSPSKSAPLGVIFLAFFALFGGIFSVLGGAALIGIAKSTNLSSATSRQVTGSQATLLGIVAIVSGVLALLFSIGAFRGAEWAWVLGVIAEIINLLSGIYQIIVGATKGNTGSAISNNIVGMVIGAIILIYLYRPNVKAYFGR
jgi:hypothetical protein